MAAAAEQIQQTMTLMRRAACRQGWDKFGSGWAGGAGGAGSRHGTDGTAQRVTATLSDGKNLGTRAWAARRRWRAKTENAALMECRWQVGDVRDDLMKRIVVSVTEAGAKWRCAQNADRDSSQQAS